MRINPELLGMSYFEYDEKFGNKLAELRTAYNQAHRDFWKAKSDFVEYSDGFQYFYCHKNKQDIKGLPGEKLYSLLVSCPFYPEPHNHEALWEMEFMTGLKDSYVVFTDNFTFNFDTISEEHLVVYCDSEKLKEFKKIISDEQLGTEHEDTIVEFFLVRGPKPNSAYILREERTKRFYHLLNHNIISIQ